MKLPLLIMSLAMSAPALPERALATPMLDAAAIAYDQKPGARLPLQDIFRDDTGRDIRLSELFGDKPVVLTLGYFRCPRLCDVARADLISALGQTGAVPGRDYTIVALSVDPNETSVDAANAKAKDLEGSPPGSAQGLHYLTGSLDNARRIMDAVGFRLRFDPQPRSLAHSVGVVFATPLGIVSGYLLGVGYRPSDASLSLQRAKLGEIGSMASPVLLLCYDYDPTTGHYTLAIVKLLRMAAVGTIVAVAGGMFLAVRRERARR